MTQTWSRNSSVSRIELIMPRTYYGSCLFPCKRTESHARSKRVKPIARPTLARSVTVQSSAVSRCLARLTIPHRPGWHAGGERRQALLAGKQVRTLGKGGCDRSALRPCGRPYSGPFTKSRFETGGADDGKAVTWGGSPFAIRFSGRVDCRRVWSGAVGADSPGGSSPAKG